MIGQVIVDLHDYLMYEQFNRGGARRAEINWLKRNLTEGGCLLHGAKKRINFYPELMKLNWLNGDRTVINNY